jgi:Fe2+ transport system protein FeoA
MLATLAMERREARAADGDLRLPAAAPGARVRVRAIGVAGDDGCRLRELGMYEGAEVTVVSQGDPVVVALFGQRFAVCGRCARQVAVELAG